MKILFSIFFLFLMLQVSAQQYNNWYFGQKAAISFKPVNNPPIPYKLENSAMDVRSGPERTGGCSSISDTSGNLLFYTNGVVVYNRNHQIMVNSITPMADTNSIWSCIIIPHPAYSDSIFYIFSSVSIGYTPGPGGYYPSPFGYYYSIVDMSGDGGNGEVKDSNILLSTSNTERLTAARHADGESLWVLTNDRFSNKFMAWQITCDGLQPNPVVSNAGEIVGDYLTNWGPVHGTMKVSPDGKQLCVVHQGDVGLEGSPDSLSFFQIFNFDNATGKISNPRIINTPAYEESATCEYSPDSRFLYVFGLAGQPVRYFLDQFEAKLATEAEIAVSRTRISYCVGSDCNNGFFDIQAAPDGKLYLNHNATKLSVISRPNVKAPGCQLEMDKIDLGGRNGKSRLPSMINDGPYDPYNNFTSQQIDSCRGIVQFSGKTAMQGAVEWHWDFGDGTTSTLQNPQHTYVTYNQPYDVKLSIRSLTNCGYIVRKNIFYPRGTYTQPAFDMVTKCDSGYTRFVNNSVVLPDTSTKYYNWYFGDGATSTEQDPVHRYAAAGIYQVKLKITTGTACIADSFTQTLEVKQLNIQAPPDQVVDAGQPVQLYVTGGGNRFQWSPPRWLSNPDIADPVSKPMDTITYSVTAIDDAGCKASDSVTLFVKNEVKGINVPSAFTPNNDGLNDIIRPLLGSQFTLKEFNIFNRWGQKVYSTSQAGEGWDGKLNDRLQDSGVYVWVIKVTDGQEKIIAKNGTVMLIR